MFPVVQRCQEGEAAWTEVAEDAAGREDLDMPAPIIVVTAGGAGSTAIPGAGSEQAMAYGAAGALAAGVVAAGAVLALRRRRA